jgi:hypothetical protein
MAMGGTHDEKETKPYQLSSPRLESMQPLDCIMKNFLISTFAGAVLLFLGGVKELHADPLTYWIAGGEAFIFRCEK